jgi:hypothetical protein
MTQQNINNEIYEERYKRYKPVSIDEVKQYETMRQIYEEQFIIKIVSGTK